MRVLSEYELDLISGGQYHGTTTRYYPSWDEFQAYFYFMTGSPSGDGGGGSAPPPSPPPPSEPDCHLVNPVGLGANGQGQAPDNARYFLPENVTQAYLTAALNHLSEYSRSHTAAGLLGEFKAMYSNPNHPHFIDFKDWGTAGGPPGSASGGTLSYYSNAAGGTVTSSAFEPFGNWFYGFAGTWAGISPDALYAAAALVQEGDNSFIPRDAPEDKPHVNAGIAAAKAYAANPGAMFNIFTGDCQSGTTAQAVGESGLLAQVNPDLAYVDPDFRAGLWGYLEERFLEARA